MKNQPKQLKSKLALLLVGFFILVLAYFFYQQTRANNRQTLTIHTLPKDATVFVDQKKINSQPAVISVQAGRYEVRVERFGFKTITYLVEVKNQAQQEYITLEAVSEQTKLWQTKNLDTYRHFATQAQTKFNRQAQELQTTLPLINRLPKVTGLYQIGSRDQQIIIHAAFGDQNQAIKALKAEALDLSPYTYLFIDNQKPDYELNPFKRERPEL